MVPPPYITGCSQAVWLDAVGQQEPMLLRNYDFAPALLEGHWLATRWSGQRVAAMGDCLWGALDGMNESGLAASLSFGGRTAHGDGFGIPLVLRYVLEIARDTASAVAILQRVPVHMCYSVTLLDARGEWATVFLNPDRPVEVTRRRAVTNFQHTVEWPEHARATSACERLAALQQQIDAGTPARDAQAALLREPVPARLAARIRNAVHGRLCARSRPHPAVVAGPDLAPEPARLRGRPARNRLPGPAPAVSGPRAPGPSMRRRRSSLLPLATHTRRLPKETWK